MSFLSQALLQYVRPEGDSAYYTIPATQDAQPRGANTVPGLVFNGAVPRVQWCRAPCSMVPCPVFNEKASTMVMGHQTAPAVLPKDSARRSGGSTRKISTSELNHACL